MGECTTLFIEGRVQKFGEVTDVFVAPDLRRQGIATRLMQEI
ncbi:GNAT family N-acetyltransferase [Candidatus Poribacteria bacterium]|nr:GNAT family N-acetyltransferase [Candidatus Poribacteria bacterium]